MTEKRWTKWALGIYFVIFLVFLYGPTFVMAILSFQGPQGRVTFPIVDASVDWWRSLWDTSVPLSKAVAIRQAAGRSFYLALACGAVTSILALSLSMAFRRRFRGDGALFYLIMLCLMTPGYLLSLGTALFWQTMGFSPDLWKTALGANAVWALPFGFLVMVAVWNRYDRRIEEAARDLGANARTTFREVTLPLIWTGVFGCLLFGFTLSWNEFDRTALLLGTGQQTLPILIFGFTTASVIRPDLYALGTGTTLVSLLVVAIILVVAAIRLRRRHAAVPTETQVREELGEVAAERELGEALPRPAE
jgi:putative spermidine/putrescine transport system permease protein